MKTISAILLFLAVVSFRPITESTAIPQKIKGIDVYVMSLPTRPYDIIETNSMVRFGTCDFFVNAPVKKASEFPGAQAVIIYWPDKDKYSIVKYTD